MMKRFITAILAILCAFTLVACSAQTTETLETEAVVVKCEKSIFMPINFPCATSCFPHIPFSRS